MSGKVRRRARWHLDNQVHAAIKGLKNNWAARAALQVLLPIVKSQTNLLKPAGGCRGWRDAELFLRGITNLALAQHYWKKPVWEWQRPDSVGSRVQFNHLVQHLFDCPHMPFFMHGVWLERADAEGRKLQKVYRQLAQGRHLRGCSLPLQLTRGAARFFYLAPDHFTIQQALFWAQAQGHGATPRLATILAQSPLPSQDHSRKEDAEYLAAVTAMLARHETKVIAAGGLYDKVAALIGHIILHRRDFPLQLLNEIEPDAADFVLRKTGKLPVHMREAWRPSGIGGYCEDELDENGWVKKTWRVRELLNAQELALEGKAQSNCVATYSHYCRAGHSSIWSLCCDEGGKKTYTTTIEIDLNDRCIVEALGRFNAEPSQYAMRVIKRWATSQQIKIEEGIGE